MLLKNNDILEDLVKRDPRDWTPSERTFVMCNRTAYVEECIRVCDLEIYNRKLTKFLLGELDTPPVLSKGL